MAATSSVRLYVPGNACKAEKKIMAVSMAGFYNPLNAAVSNYSKQRRSLCFRVKSASVPSSRKSVGTININGNKVNGISVGENPILSTGGKIISSEILGDGNGDDDLHECLLGKFVEKRFVYRQSFIIRSYETGPDGTATMETLMNLLQETALNHVTSAGLAGSGFGATREMSLRKLIWVVTRIHIQVQRYSCWRDIVEIDTWVDAAGKNAMRRDWIIRDYKSKDIIARATSTWVNMNNETRRLSKIPEQVREEVKPFYLNRSAIHKDKNDIEKIDKITDETVDRIKSGLAPRWSDMDANQHVNNVKYIGWILESVPINVLRDYDLTSMTLEYRRECTQSNLLESLTSPTASVTEDSNNNSINRKPDNEYTHLLRMQNDKAEIIRARTEWRSKQKR